MTDEEKFYKELGEKAIEYAKSHSSDEEEQKSLVLAYIAGANKDEKVNLAILQNSCDNNYLQACDWLGNYYEEGISVKKDDKKAFMLYKQACNGGNDEGCGDLGLSYYSGKITSKDEAKGKHSS